MAENSRVPKPSQEKPEIKIDYEKIDVQDIMRQIQRHSADSGTGAPSSPGISEDEKKMTPEEPPVMPDNPEPQFTPCQISRPKRILLKLMRPFSPLVKLLVLPVHQQVLDTVHQLDFANRRMDYLNSKLENLGATLSRELYVSTDRLNMKIDEFNRAVNERLEIAFRRMEDLDQTMEYVKLLHSLAHNIVVELTKLKIEHDGLKVKTRILQKDFEFLGNKEKVLEKKIFG